MKAKVDLHNIELEITSTINAGEYNITPVEFEFSSEYETLTKRAIFTNCEGVVLVQDIIDNQCRIPAEVLTMSGAVKLGVYGYETVDDTLELRASPTPKYFYVTDGSFENGATPIPPTPSDWDKLVAQVGENTEDISTLEQTKANISSLSSVAFSGSYNDLIGKPTKLSEFENDEGFIDKNVDDLTNYSKTSEFANVAFSGDYDDLIDKPDLSVYATTTELGEEISARQGADSNLQEQIDGITASSDVVDIVGTYQELQNYDTSGLGNNDIIKVLQDSTHNNAMTYYRWDKPNNEWDYVGQEGPYYTKSEVDIALQGKQATLVSGTNIKTINNSSILGSGNISVEVPSNKVTSLSSASTDTQYPSAKCVYDIVGNVETLLTTLDIGNGVA